MSIVENLSQVMRGLLLLHQHWGSHNNISINTISAREPPNEGLPNLKIQLVGSSFFAKPWPSNFQAVSKSFFRESSQKLGTYSVLPMIALYKYLDTGFEGLEE